MAAVDSDPVPNVPHPITSVDDAVVVASTNIPTVDASNPSVEENQSLSSVGVQLESDNGVVSLLEVTKLAPEELVDVVENVLSEAKEFTDATGPTIVEDETDGLKPEAAAIHLKDATAENSVSDVTTVVVANTISHDTATEISTSAEEAVPTAETPPFDSCAPVAEQELTQSVSGELNETAQPNSDEISELPKLAPAEEHTPVDDGESRPVVEEAERADNEDAEKEVEEAKPTEVEMPSEIEDKAAEFDANVDDESAAEVKAKELEESRVKVIEPEVSIQVEEATPVIEAATASSLAVGETPIDVEVVAPTPALVDNRQLEESDAEDTAASEESSSTPVIVAEQDLASEGTATPNPEPEASSTIVEEPDVVVQEAVQAASIDADAPAAEVPPVVEEAVAPDSVGVPIQVAEEPSLGEDTTTEAPITSQDEKSAPEAEPKLEADPSSKIAPVVVEEQSSPSQEEDDKADVVDSSEAEVEPIVEAVVIHAPETAEEIPATDDGLAIADDKPTTEDVHATVAQEEPAAEEPTDISAADDVEAEVPLVKESLNGEELAKPVVAQDEAASVAPQAQSESIEETPINDDKSIEEAAGILEEEAAVPQEQAAIDEKAVEEGAQAAEEQLLAEQVREVESPEDNAAEDKAVAMEQPVAAEPADVDIPLSSEENATVIKDAGVTEPLDEEPTKEETMAIDQVETTEVVIEGMSVVEDIAVAEIPATEEVVEGEVAEQKPAEDTLDNEPAAEAEAIIPAETPVELVPAEAGVEEPSEDVTGPPAVEEAPITEEPAPGALPVEPTVAEDEETVKEEVAEEMEEPTIGTVPVSEPTVEIPAISRPEVIEEPVEEETKVASEPAIEISATVEESPVADGVEDPAIEEVAEEAPAIAEHTVEPVVDAATEEQHTAEVLEAEVPIVEEPATEGVLFTEPIPEEVVPDVTTADSAVEPVIADVPATREGAVVEKEPVVPLDVQIEEAPVAEAVAEQVAEAIPVEQHSAVVETHIDVSAAEESEADVKVTDESFVDSETSEVDTTTETIMVPEPILEKKDISASFIEEDIVVDVTPAAETEAAEEITAPTRPALEIPEDASRIERPKSPWTPSFQVTTIGHGAPLPADNDIPIEYLDGAEETKDAPVPQPSIVIEDQSTESGVGEVQPSSEEAGAPESASSWTPSYSVHLQGSPSPTQVSLEPDVSTANIDQEQEGTVVTPATDDMTAPENVAPLIEEDVEHVTDAKSVEAEPTAVEEPSIIPEVPEVAEAPTPSFEHETIEAAIVVPIVEPETQAEQQTEERVQEEPVPSEPQPVESQLFEKSFEDVDVSSLTPPSEQNRSASPSWVPSYSVSRQGSPLPQPASLPSIATEVSDFNLASDATLTMEDQDVQDALPVPPTVVVNDLQPEEAKEPQAVEDQPPTHWTPSYSVTRQGTDILEDTQLESFALHDQPAEVKGPGPQPRRSLSEEMEDSAAFSATALIGAGVAGGVLAASAILGRSKDAPVANGDNGSGSRQEKAFPSVEIPDDNAKSNATPLPPLDENSALDTTSALSPESSPVSTRRRLESTTSSRLFPGGWFSNTSKIPDERTSLDVAQGVFTGTKQGPTVEDVLVSPVVEPITPDREYSSEKKRWCVIM
ncbi:hypothetical protein P691DRAFT_810536 [Macrolepiota fuliginosa MF-IS2]|uniref:Uncharacterized protein n=1 Tax=Macrolepiota fuliginosa MF-IS2 TaxID=1400762 RepID=A0A9P5XFA5_9AGAR|nr:hypothetical protein P691DRAFT_810536 [Macrolepiota fuliginosa MF-IS2]